MVKIDKIYTRGGDKGNTSLGDGTRLSKSSLRITAIGDVDEANSFIGLARTTLPADHHVSNVLSRVQNDLFDLGADLALPGEDVSGGKLRIKEQHVTRIERDIDTLNGKLSALKSFILPGGSEAAAQIHIARSIARRAERSLIALAEEETINQFTLQYLNRLSDLLFVSARTQNSLGNDDVLWVPGQNLEKES